MRFESTQDLSAGYEIMLTKVCGKITLLLWLLEQFQNVTCITRTVRVTVQQSCNLLPKNFSQSFLQNTLFCWFLFVKNIFFVTLSWYMFYICKPTGNCTCTHMCWFADTSGFIKLHTGGVTYSRNTTGERIPGFKTMTNQWLICISLDGDTHCVM